MTIAALQRPTFETSRAAEYFSKAELASQTGQPAHNFATVLLKELVDNGLDAAEEAGRAPVIGITVTYQGGAITLSIADNGGGMPAATINRIANFETRTSSKSLFRSPTRGLQGNAFKTVIGIPYALGLADPVMIESGGLRHAIHVNVTPAGAVRVNPAVSSSSITEGTAVTVTIPARDQDLFSPRFWAAAYSLFNPHASVKISVSGDGIKQANNSKPENATFYRTVDFPDGWRRFLPSEPTSPHWYDIEAFRRLAYGYMEETNPTLREFVRTFAGLTSTAKAAAIGERFPNVERLRDLDGRDDDLAELLAEMKREAREIKPAALGVIGEDHFKARIGELYGIKRHWYRKALKVIDGLPVGIEAMIAETERPGRLFTGVNFSPTYSDPFARANMTTPEFTTYGLSSMLSRAYAYPDGEERRAAVVHLTCPALEFLDRGKTNLNLTYEMGKVLTETLWPAVKELHKEGKRAEKDARREANRQEEVWRRAVITNDISVKDAVFEVLPAAILACAGPAGLPIQKRSLYYQVRKRIQDYTDKELDQNYFGQTILVEYQRMNGPIKGLYSDPRGILYEPHTGKSIPVGTREVEGYDIPEWTYNKILYTEKKGLWPILQAGQIAERHDCAVIAAEGYATEAARLIFERAQKDRNYQLFVLHDADPDGYNIARTLAEATARMPGYKVDVIDLGLTVEEAVSLGLQSEDFTRKKELPAVLRDRLTDIERQFFEGVKVYRKQWKCKRIELNMLTGPQLIALIDDKMSAYGTGKVIPPANYLAMHTEDAYRHMVMTNVKAILEKMFKADELAALIADEWRDNMSLDDAGAWIRERLDHHPAQSWRDAVADAMAERFNECGNEFTDQVKTAIRLRM